MKKAQQNENIWLDWGGRSISIKENGKGCISMYWKNGN